MKKVVSNAGTLDKTEVYLFDGHKIIETRDGSNNMVQQIVNGTQYIDEHVMMRVADKGDLYIHQDANWNVIGATLDTPPRARHAVARRPSRRAGLRRVKGSLVERYEYTPYGRLVANQGERDRGGSVNGYGDRDGDGDVGADDKGTPGTTCTGTVTGTCRILDLDFDGDYDSTDATKFDGLPQGNAAHPGQHMTGLDQQFGHQGLLFEPESLQYTARYRKINPANHRWTQRDPAPFLNAVYIRALNYEDGMSLYQNVLSNPTNIRDPFGLRGCGGWPCNCDVVHPYDLPVPNVCNATTGIKYYTGTCVYCTWRWFALPPGCNGTRVTCRRNWTCALSAKGWRWIESGGQNCPNN